MPLSRLAKPLRRRADTFPRSPCVPRLQLDIALADLLAGLAACGRRLAADPVERRVETLFGGGQATVATLSVRTAFDLLLRALEIRPGDEVVMSAFTIPHMAEIVRRHGAVAVPLDLDPDTLEPLWETLPSRLGPRTRAVVVAHLFGARCDLSPAFEILQPARVPLIEDAAQAFGDDGWRGDPRALATLFSFGTIKTRTALGSAMAVVREPGWVDALRALQAPYPRRSTRSFAIKTLLVLAQRAVLSPSVLPRFAALLQSLGQDPDRFANEATGSFRRGPLLRALRQRPSAAQLALLERRLRQSEAVRAAGASRTRSSPRQRALRAYRRVGDALPAGTRWLGGRAQVPGTWLFPITSPDRDRLAAALRSAGFDVTTASSKLCPIHHPTLPAGQIAAAAETLLYVPVPWASEPDVERLLDVLRSFEPDEPVGADAPFETPDR